MNKLCKAIDIAIAGNVPHRKKGFRLGEVSPEDALRRAAEELAELAESFKSGNPDQKELADTLICLLHLAKLKNWSIRSIEIAAIKKMLQRLRFDPKDTARLKILSRKP